MQGLRRAFAVLCVSALVAACDDGDDGDNGANGADGADGLNSLVDVRDLPLGDADCPGGGTVLDSGLDTNRDGVLDAGEVTATDFLECETAPQLRALHASPDAPDVNVLVNGAAALTGVAYGAGSGFLPVVEDVRVQVEAITPGANPIVIDEAFELDFSTDYTVIAVGRVGDPIDELVIANASDEEIFPGNARAQVVHAAPDAGPVDVYVTAPMADLSTAMPVNEGDLLFLGDTGQVEVPEGTYQIRVTEAGNASNVVFDSGGDVALPAGADLLIAAIENTGPGASPVSLVVLDGTAAATILDVNTPQAVYAVHASPDAPAVDILADVASTAAEEAIVLAAGLDFPDACSIDAVPAPESFNIDVTAAGDPTTVALPFTFDAQVAGETTAIVTGLLTSTPEIQLIALPSDTRSVITEAKVRVVHAAAGTASVDVFVLPDGTDFATAAATFGNVPFTGDSEIQSLAPGLYDIYVTPAGDKSVVAIEAQDQNLAAGAVLDVIARDPDDDGSEGPLPQLIVVDYAAIAACPT